MTAHEKRIALAAHMATLLQAIDPAYRVDDRVRSALVQARGPADQALVMGSTVRYAMVALTGFGFGDGQWGQGTPIEVADEFTVMIWHEYADADTYEASSQFAFDQVVQLVPTLAGTAWIDGAGLLGEPQAVTVDLVALDSKGDTLAHFLSFTISITSEQ